MHKVERTPANLVPIIMAYKSCSLDDAIADIIKQLHASMDRFYTAVAALKQQARAYNSKTQADVAKFVEPFETFQAGCCAFYINSPRFGIQHFQREDGSFLVKVDN